jgi:aminoglycoside phosphotransferase (APT) family kinase protein
MLISKLHRDEVDIRIADVARLVADQFPQWAGLPLSPVKSSGTDNVMLRLGDDLVVRLPRIPSAVPSLAKEVRYAPLLAAQLPVPLAVPLAEGVPGVGYPWPWTVSRWLPGETPVPGKASTVLARELADFVTALHALDTAAAAREQLTSYRGAHPASTDNAARAAIANCEGLLDVAQLTAAWDAVKQARETKGTHTWIHTDLQPGNLLLADGRLAGVLDWGGLAIGDPAVDLIVAWNLLDAPARAVFRDAVAVDDATWDRGRAWALTIGVVAYPYYVDSNPALAGVSRYQIEQVLADIR